MRKIRPIKRLGQNFLIDKRVISKVIKTANLNSKDIVLEIGPGAGALTKELAKLAKLIIAVEKDSRICEVLKENLKDFKNIEIIQGDILKLTETRSLLANRDRVSVVANLPFYITAPVIRKFLEAKLQPKEMVLIIQKEVAQRICARAPKTNLLAISVQFYANPKIIAYVSKQAFRPKPKVDAAIIKITPHQKYKKINPKRFFRTVKAGFSHPRKQLVNNLPKELKLNKLSKQRPENLSIQDWIKLSNMLK